MLFGNEQPIRRVLCLGAHADDIEIGCGGTLLRLQAAQPALEVDWHVFSAPGPRRREAQASAADFLDAARRRRVKIHSFRESYFPEEWSRIKDQFERLARAVDPDLIFTHWREDRHQDHRVLSDLAWNTFRRHRILEYEIPKYDGDLGQPNVLVALPDAIVDRKLAILLQRFPSQRRRHWFTDDTLRSILRLRGIEAGPQTRYAEAFHGRKLVF